MLEHKEQKQYKTTKMWTGQDSAKRKKAQDFKTQAQQYNDIKV